MEIREITTKEKIISCSELYVEVFNSHPWDEKWTIDTAKIRLLDVLGTPGFIGYCMLDQSVIAGCVIGNIEQLFDGRYFNLRDLFVSKRYQRKNVGQRLLSELKVKLKELKVNSIILFTSKEYYPYSFYLKNGFIALEKMRMMKFDNTKVAKRASPKKARRT